MGVFCSMLEQNQQKQKAHRNPILCEWISFPLDAAPFRRNTSVLFSRNRLSNLTDEFWPRKDEVYNDEAVSEALAEPKVPAQEPGFGKSVTFPRVPSKINGEFYYHCHNQWFSILYIQKRVAYFHSMLAHLPATGPRDRHSFPWMRFCPATYFPHSKLKGVLLFKILASRLAHEHEPLQDDGLPDPAAAISRVTTIPVSLPVLGYTPTKIEPRFRGGWISGYIDSDFQGRCVSGATPSDAVSFL